MEDMGRVSIQQDMASTGLFWFLGGYDEALKIAEKDGAQNAFDVVDEKCFDLSVLKAGTGVATTKLHLGEKPGSDKLARGRVSVVDGVIYITVGDDCPEAAIDLVKERFGLGVAYDRYIKIDKDPDYDGERG